MERVQQLDHTQGHCSSILHGLTGASYGIDLHRQYSTTAVVEMCRQSTVVVVLVCVYTYYHACTNY